MLTLAHQEARNKEIEVWERDSLQNPCTLMKKPFSLNGHPSPPRSIGYSFRCAKKAKKETSSHA
jgi:hypothetical protein